MNSVVIIGSGNVAEAFALSLTGSGNPPAQIFSRNEQAGRQLAAQCGCQWESDPAKLASAELYIVSVTDKAVRQVASSLEFSDAVVAHTAASLPADALPGSISHRAVIYPLQTFTKGRKVDMNEVPMLIEADTDKALNTVRELACTLSKWVIEADALKRSRLHIAAVFASNFTNHMFAVGEKLAEEAGFDFSILKPLIRETALKALEADSPLDTQTGPAIRNDFHTKSLHCELLVEKPDLKNIYINLSNSIWETSKKTSQK